LCPLGYFGVKNARDLMKVIPGQGGGDETESPALNVPVTVVKEVGKGSIGKASVQL
jgi:hypothetical protein